MWNKQNMVQWILGIVVSILVAVIGTMWKHYSDKTAIQADKIDALKTEVFDLKLKNSKYEAELDGCIKETLQLADEKKSLEKQLRWRSRSQ